ncbi:MAG: hypothetical protein JKY59_02255 [Emcibacter sp.]|nr:hypothetical protein [Emcibacter sp.]
MAFALQFGGYNLAYVLRACSVLLVIYEVTRYIDAKAVHLIAGERA